MVPRIDLPSAPVIPIIAASRRPSGTRSIVSADIESITSRKKAQKAKTVNKGKARATSADLSSEVEVIDEDENNSDGEAPSLKRNLQESPSRVEEPSKRARTARGSTKLVDLSGRTFAEDALLNVKLIPKIANKVRSRVAIFSNVLTSL